MSSHLPLSVFIYYRVPHARWSEAALAVGALQHALRMRHPGLQTRLMRRADDKENVRGAAASHDAGEQTWMEIYEQPVVGVQPGFLDLMGELVSRWPAGLTSARHVECFHPLQDAPFASSH